MFYMKYNTTLYAVSPAASYSRQTAVLSGDQFSYDSDNASLIIEVDTETEV